MCELVPVSGNIQSMENIFETCSDHTSESFLRISDYFKSFDSESVLQ